MIKTLKDAMGKLANSDTVNYFRGRSLVDNERDQFSALNRKKNSAEGDVKYRKFIEETKKRGYVR